MPPMPDSEGARLDREPAPYERSVGVSKGQLGMVVFLASLSVLFAACLVAMVVTRFSSAAWPRPQGGELPKGLLLTTSIMVGLSMTLHRAVVAARGNRQLAIVSSLNWAMLLAVAFVLSQVLNWLHVAAHDLAAETATLYPFAFFFLTGLHASHVLGGLLGLAVIRARARNLDYSSSRHEPLRLCAQYWHFLGVVWAVLAGALVLMR